MKKERGMFKSALLPGALLVMGLAVLVCIAEKIFYLGRYVASVLPVSLPPAVGFLVGVLLVAILVALIALVAALLLKTRRISLAMARIDIKMRKRIPGYQFFKNATQSMMREDLQDVRLVLLRVDNEWELSFLIRQPGETKYTVIVPEDPAGGHAVYQFDNDTTRWTEMTRQEVIDRLKQMGLGYRSVPANDAIIFSKLN